MRVLLLSAYDAMSHRYWREGLISQFPSWQWTQLVLPARHFNWRIRGNSLSWGVGHRTLLEADYDLLIATSMTDLSTLRGLVPKLGTIPTLVYFHENQFAYPLSNQRRHSAVELQMLNLYTGLAADRLLFNSHFNRNTFLDGVEQLLSRLPDHVPPDVRALLEARSSVLPVPLKESVPGQPADGEKRQEQTGRLGNQRIFTLLWNHRWEYDKAPERFVLLLKELLRRDLPFRVELLGQRFRQVPVEIDQLKALLGDRLGHCGYVDSIHDYQSILASVDGVLSTALHDFQGLSVLEAVAAGAIPVVPDRLAYRELFDQAFRYGSDEQDASNEVVMMADHIARLIESRQQGALPPAPNLNHLMWPALKPAYETEFTNLIRAG
ncbi:DUF3524 domain-containing protein [Aestuariirhabdus sp. Z084]|uniref:tRNA-queuosine alpha-mannosyltransferase domain-containing protein n=1 Tax=Aestuariirhabdus haliotis TaxID=2918751 RepID=UPI00201B3800|nr:DUF3524 domain-containing protein [Aestuariirhabdus haliotis]MCL6417300.1 DUF3524 domain-containing protein [Aestuariirhabdus haliotis]MCL6421245.1 DUF3524 domain-containing protein [Aestuariirhabdus haliotis]